MLLAKHVTNILPQLCVCVRVQSAVRAARVSACLVLVLAAPVHTHGVSFLCYRGLKVQGWLHFTLTVHF